MIIGFGAQLHRILGSSPNTVMLVHTHLQYILLTLTLLQRSDSTKTFLVPRFLTEMPVPIVSRLNKLRGRHRLKACGQFYALFFH